MHSLFKFTDPSIYKTSADSFVLQIPHGIESKMELLDALSNTGKFPSYFGKNWDALFDCLRDFSWISQKQVVILHSDLPLIGNAQECKSSKRLALLKHPHLQAEQCRESTGAFDHLARHYQAQTCRRRTPARQG